jgi:hypothetical protein
MSTVIGRFNALHSNPLPNWMSLEIKHNDEQNYHLSKEDEEKISKEAKIFRWSVLFPRLVFQVGTACALGVAIPAPGTGPVAGLVSYGAASAGMVTSIVLFNKQKKNEIIKDKIKETFDGCQEDGATALSEHFVNPDNERSPKIGKMCHTILCTNERITRCSLRQLQCLEALRIKCTQESRHSFNVECINIYKKKETKTISTEDYHREMGELYAKYDPKIDEMKPLPALDQEQKE